jgi:hypothetical protein
MGTERIGEGAKLPLAPFTILIAPPPLKPGGREGRKGEWWELKGRSLKEEVEKASMSE